MYVVCSAELVQIPHSISFTTALRYRPIHRKPMREKMGIKYEKIKVSAFRLSLSIRQLELRPSESELAKTIVVAIIPSADVTSPPLELKGEGGEQDHWGDKIADKLQHTKTRKGHRRRGSDRGSSNSDPVPDPFRGSNLRIQEIGMGCSFHLVKVMPLVSLVRRWREYEELQKDLQPAASSSGAGSQDKLGRGEQMEVSEEMAKTIDKQKKPEETWLRFIAFYFPAPHIRIRVKGVNIQVDKAYLAPEPPEGFIPTHRHQRSISFFGDDTLNLEEDNGSIASYDEGLPSAIVPKNAAKNSNVMTKNLPVFADQDTMLQCFAGEGRSAADSIIFHMERWVEHTSKKVGANNATKRRKESLKEDRSAKSKQLEAREGGGKTDGTSGRRNSDFQGIDEKAADEGIHDDIMNFLLKSILRRVLWSVEVECADVSLTIAGADAPTVKNARKTHAVEPYRANLALSCLGWHQRAVTVLSIESVFVSFQGPDCTLKVGIGGISMQVGMPTQGRKSRGGISECPDVAPSLHSSPGRQVGTKAGEKRKRRRTWYTIIPSDNDVVADVTGVLPILVWALNYDHFWQKRKLGINLRMSNLSLRLECTPLYTALVHLDDFADPDSSHGEWAAWLRRKYQNSISPLSDVERQTYRDCYRKSKGIQEVVQKKRGDRGVLLKHQRPSYLNVAQDKADSPGTTPVKDSSEAGSSLSKVGKTRVDTTKKNDDCQKETLAKLETRMNCDEILKERCTVLQDKWHLSASNPELQEFLALTKSDLQSRKKPPRIVPEAVFPQVRGNTVDESTQLSPFEKLYTSPVGVLVCLVREKFHLLAPSVDILADIRAIQLHFIDRSFGERAAKLMGSSSSTTSSQDVMSTTLIVKGTCIEINQQNIVFSASAESALPRVFQNISMAVDSILWRPDVPAVGNVQLPTFIDESPCGIIYKQLDNTNSLGDAATTNSMVSLTLEHKKDPIESSDSHLAINLLAGNLVFVMNPVPLASSLAVLTSFADLPFRDLPAEKEAQEAAELDKSGDGIASFRQSTLHTFSTTTKPEEDAPPPPVGIVLGGANMLLAVQLSHITVVPLPDAAGVNRGTVEATIRNISLLAESSVDGVEAAEITVSPFQVLSCRLFYVPSDLGGFVKPFHLPFKPALEFGGASINYASRPKEPIVVPVSSPTAAVGDGLEERHVFDVSLTAYVRRAAAYLSPTINASLLGALNCSSLILEYLPAPEEEPTTDPTKSTSAQEEDSSRREALKELWRMADRDGSGTLSVDEVSEIIARLFSAKAQNIFDEIPKSQQLTDMELKREVQNFLSLAGSNSTATRDLSFPEVEFLLFQKQRLQESGMTASEHAAQSHDFGSIEGLRGLIYYEDLLEYSSSTQVYALTGTLHTSKFPPPSSWRQGEGIKLFWELYERETGCTKESLNDQVRPSFSS